MAEEVEKTTQPEAEAETLEPSDLSELLKKEFKPKSERVQEEVEHAVGILAEHALEHVSLVSPDAVSTIEAIKAAIDQKLTDSI